MVHSDAVDIQWSLAMEAAGLLDHHGISGFGFRLKVKEVVCQ